MMIDKIIAFLTFPIITYIFIGVSLIIVWGSIEYIIIEIKNKRSILKILRNPRKYILLIISGLICCCYFFLFWLCYYLKVDFSKPFPVLMYIYFGILLVVYLGDIFIGAISLIKRKRQKLEWIRCGMIEQAGQTEYECRRKNHWNLNNSILVYISAILIFAIVKWGIGKWFISLGLGEVLAFILSIISGGIAMIICEYLSIKSGVDKKLEDKVKTLKNKHNEKIDAYNENLRKCLFSDEKSQKQEE